MFGVLNTVLYFPSGAVYPQQGFPGWMQVIAVVDPFTYAVHAFKCLLLKNTGFQAIAGDLAFLGIFTVVAMTLAASGFVFLAFRGGVSKRWSGARDLLRRLPKADMIERSLDSCRAFGRERGFLSRTLALSMLLNLLCVLQFFVLARGLGMDVPLLALYYFAAAIRAPSRRVRSLRRGCVRVFSLAVYRSSARHAGCTNRQLQSPLEQT